MGVERPLDLLRNTSTYIWPARSPISCLVSFIGTDKIYRLLSTCNKAATAAAVGDQDWKLAGKSGQQQSLCLGMSPKKSSATALLLSVATFMGQFSQLWQLIFIQ